ncbi:hypothetical protein HMY34_04750 [Thiothrix subterranea]|nr:hypothetical protein HMY34_04750 [Thiothrix subterranea]
MDKTILHSGILTGIAVSWFRYPEASALLFHYVYGDGSDLSLSADYFRESGYLKEKIAALGIGQHGAIGLRQQDDWRLALTLNPYYLDVTEQQVVLFHPHIAFAPLDSQRVPTIVPIGKLKIRVFDNLVSALEPKPFRAYAVWETNATSHSPFTVVRVDPRHDKLALFHRDEAGQAFNRFGRLGAWLEQRQQHLRFAMNAGMFHADFSPVGLLVMDGKEIAPLNLEAGTGNFFMKPNGVFFVTKNGAGVVESSKYPVVAHDVLLATQSGPLLVRHGIIHPALRAGSPSKYIRNGVGVAGDTVMFAISDKPVTLHEFAVFFRDQLHCQDALYLDGAVSGLYAPELNRYDNRADLGVMIGVVQAGIL